LRYHQTKYLEFDDVYIEESQDSGGCILIVGRLESGKLADLKSFVAENDPPVSVVYELTFTGDAEHGD
jgi:hypothetical protein